MSRLLLIWREELNTDDGLSPDDSFYELGGDSLTALAIVDRVADEFRVAIPLRDFLLNATPGLLLERIRDV